jgi:beta-galactosidase
MLRTIGLSFIFILVCINCLNAQIQLAQNTQRLTTGWEYIQATQGSIWEVWRDSQYQVRSWQKVDLPHCFNALDAVDPHTIYYQGEGWYRTMLKTANPYKNGRTLLHFEGAGQKTKVYLGNQEVGGHVGGYDEFMVDLTDAMTAFPKQTVFKGKKNNQFPIAVACDNGRDMELIPSNLSDFNLYGGLYRYVNLVYVPAVSIERLQIENKIDPSLQTGSMTIKAKIYNPNGLKTPLNFKIQVFDPSGKEVFTKNVKTESAETLVKLTTPTFEKPLLWDTDKPNLYQCRVTLQSSEGEMQVSEKMGFRHTEFKEKGPFFLNGKRLLLRGTHRHEDHAGTAAAMTEDMMREEMKLIKDMGANFIRLGHYQQSRIILDLCDSLGLLVWEEIPWCRGGVGGDKYRTQARRMMTNMVEQHFNHPSVFLWGLGNENDWEGDFLTYNKDSIRHFMSELNDLAHKLDPSRLTSIRRCAFCSDIPDVYSPSIWAGWYRGLFTEYKTISEVEMKKVKRYIHVEWGADNHVGRYSDESLGSLKNIKTGGGGDERAGDYLHVGGAPRVSKDGDWSETYFCDLADWHLKEQEIMPWLTGTAQWVFKDFSTPLRPENPIPYMNQKGIVERDLTKKDVYYVFQSYWADKPMVHILGQKWDVRTGKKGEEKLVKIYPNCPEVELFLNGKSIGTKKRTPQDYPAAGLRWNVVFKEGKNTLKAVAKKGNETFVDEKTLDYSSKTWGTPHHLKLFVEKREGDMVTLSAKLFDAKGVQCVDGNLMIEFGLAGEGALIENQGTSTGVEYHSIVKWSGFY